MGRRATGIAAVLAAVVLLGLAGSARPATAAFPGGVGKLAFERYVKHKIHITIANPNGSSPVPLHLPATLGETRAPHWSGDGKRLLVETVSRQHIPTGLFVVNADGTGLMKVGAWSLIRRATRGTQFSWDAAGKRIYWLAGGAHGTFTIESATMAGTKVRKIVTLRSSDGNSDAPYGVAVSPDGKRVAYVADAPPGTLGACPDPALFPTSGLWVIGASGGTPHLVASNALAIAPDWSPDGSELTYTGERPDPLDPSEACLQGIYTVGASGTGQQVVWEYEPSTVYPPIANDPVTPVFSPDGAQIAFRASYWKLDQAGDHGYLDEIFIVNANGTGIHALTNPWTGNPVFQDYAPSWQPR